MSAMDFPTSPTVGQVFVNDIGIGYTWNGVAWVIVDPSETSDVLLASWEQIFNRVKAQIPTCPDALIRQEIYDIMFDFCDQTNILQETVAINVQPQVYSYNFSVFKGRPNRLLLLYDPANTGPDKKWVQGNVQMLVPGTITIGYSPSSAAVWNAIIAKTCGDLLNGFPDISPNDGWIIDKYREGLAAGAMGRLLTMPAKAFSNPALGGWYRQFYIADRSKARQDANQANVIDGQRWMYPQGWASPHRGGWA